VSISGLVGQGAEQSFLHAIKVNPRSRDAHCEYGYLLIRLARFDEALTEMEIWHGLKILEKLGGGGMDRKKECWVLLWLCSWPHHTMYNERMNRTAITLFQKSKQIGAAGYPYR